MRPDLKSQDQDCWYELYWRLPYLSVRVLPEAANFVQQVDPSSTKVRRLQSCVDLPEFTSSSTDSTWGFGPCLKMVWDGNWVAWRAELTNSQLSEFETDRDKLFALTCSFSLLFNILYFGYEGPGDPNRHQLLAVKPWYPSPASSPIQALVSPKLREWVSLQPFTDTDSSHPLVEAMHQAHEIVMPLQSSQRFSCKLDQGMVHLGGPERRGLDPAWGAWSLDGGYELQQHNLDSPLHALLILVGLAKLHQLARRDGF